MRPLLITFLFFIAIINHAVIASDPVNEEGLYLIKNYSRKDYNAATQNWAIIQDLRGVMYFGNNEGILEYDGVSWRKIYTTNQTTVRSFAIDSNGIIYVGAKGEIGYLEPDSAGEMQFISLLDKIPQGHRDFADVWKTHATKDGVYFQSLTIMFFYQPHKNEIKIILPKTRFHISFLISDVLYIVQREIGLCRLEDNKLITVPGGELFVKETIMAMMPFSASADTPIHETKILIGSRNVGLFLFDGKSITPFKSGTDNIMIKSQVYHGTSLPNGFFAVATLYNGVIILDQKGRVRKILDPSSGLNNQSVRYVYPDRQGGLWMALEDGIARAEITSPFSVFGEVSGIKGKIYSLIRHQGKVFAGTNLGLFSLKDAGNSSHPQSVENKFLPIPGISAMCWSLQTAGNFLLVASGEGLYQVSDLKSSVIRKGITFTVLQSTADTSRFFLGLMEGLVSMRYMSGHWIDEGKISDIDEEIRTLAEDGNGDLWAGTRNKGLIRVRQIKRESEDRIQWKVDRFGVNHGFPGGGVNVFKTAGRMIFAGRYGLFRFDEKNNRFVPDEAFSPLSKDSTAHVPALAEDYLRTLWIPTYQNGKHDLVSAHPQESGNYSLEKTPFPRFNDFIIITLYADNDGIIWIGGPDGLIRYDSRIKNNYKMIYPTLLRRVTVGDGSVIYGGTFSKSAASGHETGSGIVYDRPVDYYHNSFRFEFAGQSYDRESENQYQHFLEGYETKWSEWSNETKKDYTNISEGQYRFHVRAKNIYGSVSDESVFEFVILPPWYRAWWAFLIYGVCIILSIWGIVYWRSRHLITEKQLLEKLVSQRTADLAQRTSELAQKEKQLEKIDQIVRVINSKIHIDDFLNTLLNEIAFTDKIQNAAVLMFHASNGCFRFTFARGWNTDRLSQIELTPFEAESRYARESCKADEDIYLVNRTEPGAADNKFADFTPSQSMLVMRIRNQDAVSGYIIFDRMNDEDPFTNADIQMLSRLRQHILSGFTKAQLVTHLQQANVELKKLSDTKSEFLGIAAHDLRNPLGAIIGFIDLLVMDMKDNRLNIPEAISDLEIVLTSARQMVNLITELLDISAIESGKVNLDLQRYNMNLIFEECERIHRKHALQKNIRLVIDKNKELPEVLIDKSRIAEVVDNLLSNAIKYTFPEGQVRLYAEALPNEVCVHIQDSGQGLNEHDLQQVFRSFKKLSARPTGGESSTGFGLAIVKKIVELHHGKVWVDSKINEGSTFSFSIPVSRESAGL